MAFNGVDVPVQDQLKYFYDAWGTNQTYPHFAVPWAWAFDTPYKWMKQIPSFFGGTRQGVAISWPGHIADKGGIRNQFHHIIDIVPTILETTGISAPVMVDGIGQKPIEGVSMAYTFDKANADAPSHHHTQYFEMFGVQGLYSDGWILSAVPSRPPWNLGFGKVNLDPASSFTFELYDVRHDWTQNTDVAARNQAKAKEMTDLMFWRICEISGAAARCLGDNSCGYPASKSGRWSKGLHVFRRAGNWHSGWHGAEHAQHLLHDHRQRRGAPGWRRGRDCHRRRSVRRLWPLSA
jgi:arylsulfatase A-like enzyme